MTEQPEAPVDRGIIEGGPCSVLMADRVLLHVLPRDAEGCRGIVPRWECTGRPCPNVKVDRAVHWSQPQMPSHADAACAKGCHRSTVPKPKVDRSSKKKKSKNSKFLTLAYLIYLLPQLSKNLSTFIFFLKLHSSKKKVSSISKFTIQTTTKFHQTSPNFHPSLLLPFATNKSTKNPKKRNLVLHLEIFRFEIPIDLKTSL